MKPNCATLTPPGIAVSPDRPLLPASPIILALVLAALSTTPLFAAAPGTAITYQGRLLDGGAPASGTFDFWIKVYDAPSGGNQQGTTVTANGVPVTNGLFTLSLDFGPGVFTGGECWLDLWLHNSTNAPNDGWTGLEARQPLPTEPSALFSVDAGVADVSTNLVSGAIAAAHLKTPTAPNAGQLVTFDGSSLAWASRPIGWGASWLLTGESGTVPGSSFVGTLDTGSLQLGARGMVGLSLQPSPSGGVSLAGGNWGAISPTVEYGVIGGGYVNQILDRSHGANISGGRQSTIGANSRFASIGGGGNNIASNSWGSAIASGQGNQIGIGVQDGVISGGSFNTQSNGGMAGVIGGGGGNALGAQSIYGTVIGGAGNQISSNVWYSVIGGGTGNRVGADYAGLPGNGHYATVLGGSNNVAGGEVTTIAGGAGNMVTNEQDTIGGGTGNYASGGGSVVRGGQFNLARGYTSVLGGGTGNWADEWDSTITGGASNWVMGVSSYIGGGAWSEALNYWGAVLGGQGNSAGYITTIGGGLWNTGDNLSAIGGGTLHEVSGWCGATPGGSSNVVRGAYGFAAGRGASAIGDGVFVWADTVPTAFGSPVTNQFAARATGGVVVNAGTNNFELASGGLKVTGAGLGSGTPVFVHQATAANTSAHITTIANPYTDGNPNAILLLTHNWSLDHLYETNHVGVWYNGARWTIYHENGAAMAVGTTFNVMVIRP